MTSPVRNPKITSDYGIKRKLPDGREDIHDGIDYISKDGNKNVFAICNGFVAYDFDDYCVAKRYQKPNTGGNMIIITSVINNKTYHIRYLHLRKNNVFKGQFIPEGVLIGVYGDVGYSFGAHLHLDIYNSTWTKKINPHELGL
jgi:murein DD-endopeptidase MepM/ murein hydrolase activator NlpD